MTEDIKYMSMMDVIMPGKDVEYLNILFIKCGYFEGFKL